MVGRIVTDEAEGTCEAFGDLPGWATPAWFYKNVSHGFIQQSQLWNDPQFCGKFRPLSGADPYYG